MGGDTELVSAPVSLCDSCQQQKVIKNTRGSSFSMCERSKTDPSFPKYPRIPVEKCPGYERAERPES